MADELFPARPRWANDLAAAAVPAEVARAPLTRAEAQGLVDRIKVGLDAVRRNVFELHERRGWESLGYSSWRECILAEFPQGQSHLYRQLDAARVELIISPIGEIGAHSEGQLRPLGPLVDEPEELREAWSRARERSGGQPTGRIVQAAVDEVLARREARSAEKMAAMEAAAGAAGPAGLAGWELIKGDCAPAMEAMPPGGVRLVVADPPYNIGVDYGHGYNDSLPRGEYLDRARRWLAAASRLLAEDGTLWLVVNHEVAADLELIVRDEVGLAIRGWPTWFESFGTNCTNNFNRCTRPMLYAVKNPKACVFNRAAVTRPSNRQAVYHDRRAAPEGKVWDDLWGVNPPIPRVAGTHAERAPAVPNQLPLGLLRPIIGCCSDPGDVVLDPFAGSGSSGLAAIELGRRFVGVERNPEVAAIARLRAAAARG